MVLAPMGGMDAGGFSIDAPVPQAVRQTHAKYWWAFFALTVLAAVVELVALDFFGVIFEGALAFIVWYMAKNSCKNMTQYCLFVFGLMCLIEALFEVLTLTTMMEGRTVSSTTSSSSSDKDGNTIVYYTTVVEETSFFDLSQGLTYNAESVGYLLSPAIMIVGTILSYFSYNEYGDSLWGDDVEEGRTQDLSRLRDDRPQAAEGGRRQGLTREASRTVPIFEGRSQRLTD